MKLTGTSNIKHFVQKYIESRDDLSGKIVIDIPAGTGFMSEVLFGQGAKVEAYDLFPGFFQFEKVTCKKADLNRKLPLGDGYADLILCQEGIEHLPNQLMAFQEFNRILRKNGKLVLTTPNASHLRARFSHFLLENEIYNQMPINEIDSIWFSDEMDHEIYYGHIFLIGIQKLKILAKLSGFSIVRIYPVKISMSSAFLGIFLPLIFLVNIYAYYASLKKNKNIANEWKRKVYDETFSLNMNPNVLFGKHLFIEFQKDYELSEVGAHFYKKHKEHMD